MFWEPYFSVIILFHNLLYFCFIYLFTYLFINLFWEGIRKIHHTAIAVHGAKKTDMTTTLWVTLQWLITVPCMLKNGKNLNLRWLCYF